MPAATTRPPPTTTGSWSAATTRKEGESEPLDVRRITAPTLVLHGTDDPLFPLPHGQALAETIPGARLVELPGVGHEVPPPQVWDVVVPALLEHTG